VAVRRSQSLVPTLREDPADAEALSHKLMLRAGLIRQLGAGIYLFLPLGQRVLDKVNAIIREEMNAIGGQEITMPVIHPAEIWKQSGRWEGIPEMFKLQDRYGRDLCLGMTHEEVVAWLAAREIRSYRDLPQIWYQIQTKERDEARPRAGVLRTREFLMKDSYTLDPRGGADARRAHERRSLAAPRDRPTPHDQVAPLHREDVRARARAGPRRPRAPREEARARPRPGSPSGAPRRSPPAPRRAGRIGRPGRRAGDRARRRAPQGRRLRRRREPRRLPPARRRPRPRLRLPLRRPAHRHRR